MQSNLIKLPALTQNCYVEPSQTFNLYSSPSQTLHSTFTMNLKAPASISDVGGMSWMTRIKRGYDFTLAKEHFDSLTCKFDPLDFVVSRTADFSLRNIFPEPVLSDESHPGLSGFELLEAIARDAARGFRSQSYSAAQHAIFSSIDNVMINGARGVYAVYSQVFVPGVFESGGKYVERGDQNGDGYTDLHGMNIEHLFPQSYFGEHMPMKSDLHHLLPTFMHPNSVRGRLPFGEVEGQELVYENKAGAKAAAKMFEPPDEVKGQVARALFYFLLVITNKIL